MNLYWANTRYPGPRERIQERLAGEDQVILHTKMKLGFEIEKPIEIYAAKAEAGKLGDNLPPGAPIEYIDLSESHPKYRLEDTPLWDDFVVNLGDPYPNIHQDHYDKAMTALQKLGMSIPRYWVGPG